MLDKPNEFDEYTIPLHEENGCSNWYLSREESILKAIEIIKKQNRKMNNISWAKTVGNWGKTDAPEVETVQKSKYEKLSAEEFLIVKNELLEKCSGLLNLAAESYKKAPNKELHDAIVTIDMSIDSLKKMKS